MKLFVRALAATLFSLIAAMLVPLPAAAQPAWNVPTITVFGNDPCPRDTICVRAPDNERYRIPKELRGDTGRALAERWGDRAKSLEYVGASGTQSCSPVGAGGATGCYDQLARAARAEQAAAGVKPTIPLKF